MSEGNMIYGLIGQAMRKIGAIGKDSYNGVQKYKFRGIDAVYNALNPVMSELGLFIAPEVLEQTREERKSSSGGNLIYSILKIKFTLYAPDGSNVSCIVIGEGMDSGDKASNKAMSVAMKYACFELFMIPTEEMVDPDTESPEAMAGGRQPNAPKHTEQQKVGGGLARVSRSVPPINQEQEQPKEPEPPKQPEPEKPKTEVEKYLLNEMAELRKARGISPAENNALFKAQLSALIKAKLVPEKKLAEYTKDEAETIINLMYSAFEVTGTELKAQATA